MRARINWKEKSDGQGYLDRLGEIGGRSAQLWCNSDRRKLETPVREEISKVEGQNSQAGGVAPCPSKAPLFANAPWGFYRRWRVRNYGGYHHGNPKAIFDFCTVSSVFYPELASWFDGVNAEWLACEEKKLKEECSGSEHRLDADGSCLQNDEPA